MQVYNVNEIFPGLEGEGHNPGVPTVRVRLQGCNVSCKLRAICDQQEALGPKGQIMLLDDVVRRVLDMDAGTRSPYPWVSISGGEPLEQNIEPLIWALQTAGKRVRVETSGMPRRLEGPVDYIRVSPKERYPKNTKQDWGLELSVVYTGVEELEEWRSFGNFAMRTLQPVWVNGKCNMDECVSICMNDPIWQLSVQTHKFIGIP